MYVKSVGRESALGGVNQVTLYDCDLDVTVTHPRGDHTAGTTFLLDPEFLASLVSGVAGLEVADARVPFRRLAAPVSPGTHLIYRALVRLLTDEPRPDPLVVDDALFALVRRVLRELPAARPSRRRAPARLRRRVPEMQAYVEARAHRAVSLAELGRFFGCSPEYVSRIFAEEVGVPLSRYVLRLRMHRAVERILDGAASLSDVALETGFASHSHLCTAMRREMGLAPGQLRAKHRAAAPQNPQFRE
jgi:AraC-like DNA-binding protein